jgi:Holliday junction DNA helicase RuvA
MEKMIDFLRGSIAYREQDYIVLDVNGVGYRVFVANPYVFPGEDQINVYIHHHVREDAILLYGFQTKDEQALFRKLIDVSGIGPRVAVGILSGGKPGAVVAAIRNEDITFLTRLPGIGKKTAQRMILDLKDRLEAFTGMAEAAVGIGIGEKTPSGSTVCGVSAWSEAKEALLALGYSEAETDRAWSAVKSKAKETDSAEALMKLALQALFSG